MKKQKVLINGQRLKHTLEEFAILDGQRTME